MKKGNKMIQSYMFYPIDSRMYIWQEGDSAMVIDPCVSKNALLYLKGKNINRILVILTHEHYDHISGVNWLKENFENVCVLCSQLCADALDNPCRNCLLYTSDAADE
mgnify:CR=1 FL=1